jgi:acetoin utilization protein AcuB
MPTGPEITAREIMTTTLVHLEGDRPLWDAWTLMSRRSIRHLVITSRGTFLGIIDEVRLLAAWPPGPWDAMATPIRVLLRDRPSCVSPDCELSQVAAIMTADQVDAVGIVDQSGDLLGLLTASDVLHAVARLGLRMPDLDDPHAVAAEALERPATG